MTAQRGEPAQQKGQGWLAATCYPVGSLDDYSWSYSWNGELHPTREAAIKAGVRDFGSDDFNVGQVEDGSLVWWGWMTEEHAEDREAAAAGLNLAVAE